jgi:hypothetical protein
MRRKSFLVGILVSSTIIFSSCGDSMTVCECLRDNGSNKRECDRLAEKLTPAELNREMAKCK